MVSNVSGVTAKVRYKEVSGPGVGAAAALCLRFSRVGCRRKGCTRSPYRCGLVVAARRLTCRVCLPAKASPSRGFDSRRGVLRDQRRDRCGPVRSEISSCPWWSVERRRHACSAGREALFPRVTDPSRVSRGGRDIGVDSLAAELVIDRGLAHG